ncbi:gliding motility-associated peptidyl-prolyl isomerase GldI [Maribacter algicola]|uniref:Gliding motility-associated peptidyl-prolyl isomerase GldI n=1 Tax=Meishania litoralis TaxID=3434685 RepID=A0ACC7LNA7_9FLAO
MRHFFKALLIFCLIVNCGGPEPRRPVKVKSSTYFGGDIERNKKLLAAEEKLIKDYIAKDSLHLYEPSASGSWYFYHKTNESSDYTPQPDDLVTMTYNIMGFDNDTIYSQEEIGVIKYKVDKQELFQGIRHSVKILKEGETATFLYPSSLAFGYQGDGDRIGVNLPIRSTITILEIEKQEEIIQN